MDNSNIVLATNIQSFRKKCGFTQEEFAQKLGVTFQAVSKWENAKSTPDIFFLPTMADLFDCSIDELFSRDIKTDTQNNLCEELPWEDDDVIRVFQAQGKRILKSQERNSLIEVRFPRECNESTCHYFKVEVLGNMYCDASVNGDVMCHGKLECHEINGRVDSKANVEIGGYVSGGCHCGGSIEIGGYLSGGANCGDSISVGGDLSGACNCGSNIECGGDILGDINCEGSVAVGGSVNARIIKCNSVCCDSLKCEQISDNVKLN